MGDNCWEVLSEALWSCESDIDRYRERDRFREKKSKRKLSMGSGIVVTGWQEVGRCQPGRETAKPLFEVCLWKCALSCFNIFILFLFVWLNMSIFCNSYKCKTVCKCLVLVCYRSWADRIKWQGLVFSLSWLPQKARENWYRNRYLDDSQMWQKQKKMSTWKSWQFRELSMW